MIFGGTSVTSSLSRLVIADIKSNLGHVLVTLEMLFIDIFFSALQAVQCIHKFQQCHNIVYCIPRDTHCKNGMKWILSYKRCNNGVECIPTYRQNENGMECNPSYKQYRKDVEWIPIYTHCKNGAKRHKWSMAPNVLEYHVEFRGMLCGERERDRQTDRQTGRQTEDRQTERKRERRMQSYFLILFLYWQ